MILKDISGGCSPSSTELVSTEEVLRLRAAYKNITCAKGNNMLETKGSRIPAVIDSKPAYKLIA